MNSIKKIAIVIVISIMTINCATKVPLTKQLVQKYHLQSDDLKKIQYYLSNDILLRREVTETDAKYITKGHTLKREKGVLIEEINFKSGLPGIAKKAGNDSLLIFFESDKSLVFTFNPFIQNKNRDRKNVKCFLVINKMKIDKTFETLGVEYGKNLYNVLSKSGRAHLLIIESDLAKIERITRRAKGMKL